MANVDGSQSGMDPAEQRRAVADYYGKTLATSTDLKTSACCAIDAVPPAHQEHLAKLHPDVVSRFYGCGSPIPESLDGCTVLDLGCGTGRDVYLASALVGKSGRVIGVDMTDEQLAIARKYRQYHAETFFGAGTESNVDFRKGFIEDLQTADIGDDSVDVVISNCVCNLSPDKKAVFAEVARVLRAGGEFYFSDIYADRRLSEKARKNELLVAECLGGALYIEDFRRIMSEVGFKDIRVVTAGPIQLHDVQLKELVQDVTFYSITIRAFKVPGLEDRRENYGQIATYASCCGAGLKLDIDNNFEKRVPRPVDANTAAILQSSRFSGKFEVTARGEHQGLFTSHDREVAIGSSIDCFRPAAGGNVAHNANKDNDNCCAPSCCTPSTEKSKPVATSASDCAVSDVAKQKVGTETVKPANGAPMQAGQKGASCCGPRKSSC